MVSADSVVEVSAVAVLVGIGRKVEVRDNAGRLTLDAGESTMNA